MVVGYCTTYTLFYFCNHSRLQFLSQIHYLVLILNDFYLLNKVHCWMTLWCPEDAVLSVPLGYCRVTLWCLAGTSIFATGAENTDLFSLYSINMFTTINHNI